MTPTEQVRNAIAQYGRPYWVTYVPMSIVKQVPYTQLVKMMDEAQIVDRNTKQRTMLAWAAANSGTEITTQQVADMMGVSHPTAKKFLKEHANRFTFVKRGTYKVN